MKIIYRVILLFFASNITVNASSEESLSGRWKLEVSTTKNLIITNAIINFSEIKSNSCFDGEWKKVIFESYKTINPKFFPIEEEISYRLEGSDLLIGRNTICDAYLHLKGKLGEGLVEGEYISFGWDFKRIGKFTLYKIK